MNYPKAPEENKRFRLEVLSKAQDNHRAQYLFLEKCKKDILFFVNVFCFTYDPRVEPSTMPFITYDYQDNTLLDLVQSIEQGGDVFIEKSRDMGMSWMIVVLQVWGFLNGYGSLYGSYKQDYVDTKGDMDSHFERLRFVIDKLPSWLMPKDIDPTYMNISSQELGCNIAGDAGANFGTGGRRKFVIHDEFALWSDDKKAFRKTKDVTNCRIFCGTPEGKYNVYGMVMTNHPDYQHLNIKRITLHWSLHPKKDQQWYEEQKSLRTKLDIAKELDISYEDSVTGAVYPEFTERVRFEQVSYDQKLPLYTSWDFGRDMNVIVWYQKDFNENKVYVIDAYQVKDKPIEFMASFILGYEVNDPVTGAPFFYDDEEKEIIKRHKSWEAEYAGHYGDPYNGSSRTTNARSSIKDTLFNNYRISITLKKTNTSLEERIRKAHMLLPRLVVNNSLTDFIQAIVQSRYPDETKQMTSEKTKPIHNEFSHFRTALEYFADNEPPVLAAQEKPLNYNPSNATVFAKSIDEELSDLFNPSPTNSLNPWHTSKR